MSHKPHRGIPRNSDKVGEPDGAEERRRARGRQLAMEIRQHSQGESSCPVWMLLHHGWTSDLLAFLLEESPQWFSIRRGTIKLSTQCLNQLLCQAQRRVNVTPQHRVKDITHAPRPQHKGS